ncbi:polyadenylate-binding protein [Plakobranchus ocellatus]|uniref:Polyadenylate-binding protein n=1 Tax=Plakobranchus ocellatus TaxID=259542 RepID=A0AAV3YGJ1_9GAST|nr:polyadenylate-binding protein [Plakobranchus ocellatus]
MAVRKKESEEAMDKNCTVYVNNFGDNLNDKSLHELFSTSGHVVSAKVKTTPLGQSLGYGFVTYRSRTEASAAIKALNNHTVGDRNIYVNFYQTRDERSIVLATHHMMEGTNLQVQNLHESIDDLQLEELFQYFGTITSAKVMTKKNKSLGYGFVCYTSRESAQKAIDQMNNQTIHGNVLSVKVHVKKKSRQKGNNLRVDNLDPRVDDVLLKREFQKFGTITSAKVMTYAKGNSKGYGYVCFSSPEEAKSALRNMHNKWLGQKPLTVTIDESKNDGEKSMFCGSIGRTASESSEELEHMHYMSKSRSESESSEESNVKKDNSILIRNLDTWMTNKSLVALFSQFGTIINTQILEKDNDLRPCAIVTFTSREEAERAIWEMDHVPVGARDKYFLEVELYDSDQERVTRPDLDEDSLTSEDEDVEPKNNLYIKKLHPEINDGELRQAFSPYGTVCSAMVVKSRGKSKQFGYVSFRTIREAKYAKEEMHKRPLRGIPLFVTYHQSKEERQEFLHQRLLQRLEGLAEKGIGDRTSSQRQRARSQSRRRYYSGDQHSRTRENESRAAAKPLIKSQLVSTRSKSQPRFYRPVQSSMRAMDDEHLTDRNAVKAKSSQKKGYQVASKKTMKKSKGCEGNDDRNGDENEEYNAFEVSSLDPAEMKETSQTKYVQSGPFYGRFQKLDVPPSLSKMKPQTEFKSKESSATQKRASRPTIGQNLRKQFAMKKSQIDAHPTKQEEEESLVVPSSTGSLKAASEIKAENPNARKSLSEQMHETHNKQVHDVLHRNSADRIAVTFMESLRCSILRPPSSSAELMVHSAALS